jgi:hypothetical protein
VASAHRRSFGLAACSLWLAACVTDPGVRAGSKPARAELKYTAVYVDRFTVQAAGVDTANPKPYVEQAQAACLGQLIAAGLFERAASPAPAAPEPGALVVRAELTALSAVGDGGAAHTWDKDTGMTFDVSLVDGGTGTVVARRAVRYAGTPLAEWIIPTGETEPAAVGARIADFAITAALK